VIVPETISGTRRPGRCHRVLAGEQRGLHHQRVEHGLEQQQVDAALDQRGACSR
jgi:hypothetical protein